MLRHRLVFLRHGETDWNAEGRLQGRQDIPLNPKGRHQAEKAGRTVTRILGHGALRDPGLAFLCSPMLRARQTMEIARAAMGLPVQDYAMDERLVELTFGEWEGLTWPEVKARAPEAASWREGDKWRFTPPSGESYAMLADRLAPWVESLDREAVVVSHGGVARALMAMLAGMPEQQAALADIWQGRALVFHNGKFNWI
ncbi:MAG: histidine phosphatase family protein [Beijerinckiaceae bacterium]|nr:histidine phosphatase family protein [Beijerinckiaceae bacterium]